MMAFNSSQLQRIVFGVGIILFFIKIIAWWLTDSTAVLTDALESTINIVAAGFTLYSIYLSNTPKDLNHPYGHGKIQFIAATVEGALIVVAGVFIFIHSINDFFEQPELRALDWGGVLILSTAIINFFLGYWMIQHGKKSNELVLVAGGKHLQTDTWSSLAIVIGLFLVHFTNLHWIDSGLAFLLSIYIFISGYKIMRESIAGIMDETNPEIIEKIVEVFNKYRKDVWIDVHNVRIIQFGNSLHIDAHITMPWYMSVKDSHEEISTVAALMEHELQQPVELFIHIDPCIPSSCKICLLQHCDKRIHPFEQKLIWDSTQLMPNKKHKSSLGKF
ncbi:MAG: cation diffusion facilitator family transporter [Cytophagaceae bacterium]